MLLLMDLLSTHCFACTGAMVGLRAGMRHWQIFLAAMLTAVGGGTTRELLLGSHQLFWLLNLNYLLAIGLAIPLAIIILKLSKVTTRSTSPQRRTFSTTMGRVVESIGTSVFIFVGILAATQANCGLPTIVLAGMFTGIGGGMIRQLILESGFDVTRNTVNIAAAFITALICTVGILAYAEPVPTVLALAAIHLLLVKSFERPLPKTNTPYSCNRSATLLQAKGRTKLIH